MPRTLAEYLKIAGVESVGEQKEASAEPKQPAKKAEQPPAKKAEQTPNQPAKKAEQTPAKKESGGLMEDGKQPSHGEAAGGHEPRDKHTEGETEDTGGSKSAETKTAEQQWLSERGVDVSDAKTAKYLYDREMAALQEQKEAHQQKLAQELEARGAIQYHGMLKESCAIRMADGEASLQDASKVAAIVGCDVNDIVGRASEIRKVAEQLAGAQPAPALVGNQWGSAARINNSESMGAAERNDNTTDYRPEAVGGTRGPVAPDEKLIRFVDVATLPGNPGLNHGQPVDQGKGPGPNA